MRRLVPIVVALACGAPAKSPPSTSATEWTSRCAARIDAARTKLALAGTTKTDASPWNPSVRFELHTSGGYYEASVAHGRGACIDFDSDDPSFTNLAWSNGQFASKVAVERIRRMNGDEAHVGADKVPPETVAPFRAAFESALEACLSDAHSVPVGPVPKDISCIDKTDKCPDSPSTSDAQDGCPDH